MTDRDGPLWARSLADQPQAADDDVIVRVLEEEPEPEPERDAPAGPAPAPPQPGERPVRTRALLAGLAAAGVVLAVASVLEGGGTLRIEEVPSGWEEIPMTCETLRVEEDGRAAERFRCRALEGGGRLPPGRYRSPDARWSSDLTREPALESDIRISRDGDLVGSARY